MVGPNAAASSSRSAIESSRTVRTPSSSSRSAVRVPMPQMLVTGRSPITSSHEPEVRRATPPGLAKPVAVLAWSFVSPIPTAQVSPVSATTRSLIARARRSGSSQVAPTKASSQPQTSTTTGKLRSVAITCSDAASYAGRSVGRKTASGHLRAAAASGMPDRTPQARAS